MSGGRGSPRIGRSKVGYKARSMTSNKIFSGSKFVDNHKLPWRQDVVYAIVKKYYERGMDVQVLDLKVTKDTFFL